MESIIHNPSLRFFLLKVDGFESRLEYEREDQIMTITHTYVPPELRGKGVAGRLVETALAYARQEKMRVDPRCSYVDSFMRRYKEYEDLRS